MGTTKHTAFWVLGTAWALASCAPKATVVAETPAEKKVEKAPVQPVVEEPVLPVQQDDGLRGPDMLVMPGEGNFRSTNPAAPKPGAGAVISRPPTDPPSRVKPKPADGE